MFKINSVQWRFVGVIVGIVALTAIILTSIFTQIGARGGNLIVDDVLLIATEDFLARRANDPLARPPDSPSVKAWPLDDPALPAEIRQHATTTAERGFDVQVGDTFYRALVFRYEEKSWVMLNDTTRRLAVRRNIRITMMVVSVTVTLLALGIGFWLSNVLLNPINRMLRATLESKEGERLDIAATSYPDNEIGELARALDAYSLRLQGFIEREQAFAADISHELRTPMTVILNTCEVIAGDPEISPATLDRLQRIERAAREMSDMINALLVLAKEAPGTRRECAVDLSDVIRQSAEQFRYQLDGKPVFLEVLRGGDFAVFTSEALLYVAVSNLIRNAFAYTERGTITVALAERTLTVHNPAGGIPASYLVTDGHPAPNDETLRANGIGLSLVRRICQHQDWTLTVDSSEAAGSTVSIRFPE